MTKLNQITNTFIKSPHLFPIILIVVIQLVWTVITPMFQTPDEQAHYGYVYSIAERLQLIDPELLERDNTEFFLELNEYTMKLDQVRTVFNINYHRQFDLDYESSIQTGISLGAMSYPPGYYIFIGLFYLLGKIFTNSVLALFLISRVGNIFLNILSYYFVYKFAGFFLKSQKQRIYFSLGTVLWPMFAFITAGINNDTLLFTSSYATFYYLLEILNSKEISKKTYIWLSIWIAIGLLSKPHYYFLLPIIGITLLYKLIRNKKEFFKMLLTGIALPIPVLYYLRTYMVFGTFLPKVSSKPEAIESCYNTGLAEHLRVLIFPRLNLLYRSFVGNFGWLDTKLSTPVYTIVAAIFAIGILGLVFAGIRLVIKRQLLQSLKEELKKPRFLLLFLSAIIAEAFMIYLYLGEYNSRCYTYFPTQGRYYFFILPILFMLIVRGLLAIVPEKFHDIFMKLLLFMIIIFESLSFYIVIYRYFL